MDKNFTILFFFVVIGIACVTTLPSVDEKGIQNQDSEFENEDEHDLEPFDVADKDQFQGEDVAVEEKRRRRRRWCGSKRCKRSQICKNLRCVPKPKKEGNCVQAGNPCGASDTCCKDYDTEGKPTKGGCSRASNTTLSCSKSCISQGAACTINRECCYFYNGKSYDKPICNANKMCDSCIKAGDPCSKDKPYTCCFKEGSLTVQMTCTAAATCG